MSNSEINIVKSSHRRSMYVLLAIFLASSAILVKVFFIQIIEGEMWKEKYALTIQSAPEYPQRGNILSRDLKILVTSMPNYKVAIDMRTPLWDKYFGSKHLNSHQQQALDSLCRGLKQYIPGYSSGMVRSTLWKIYKQQKQYYFDNKLNEVQLNKIKNLPILREGKFKAGLIYTAEAKRVKPYEDMAGRTLGSLNSEGKGLVGIEFSYNEELQGKPGTAIRQKLPGGYWVPMEDKYSVLPEPGFDLVSTINVNLQDITHMALLKQLKRFRAHHGTAVLMEVETGDILAISNLTDTLGKYIETFNYAVAESTEPGSTIKLASMMVMLEDGKIDLDDTVDTKNAPFIYATHPIRDTHTGYGILTMLNVFKVSSNVGVAKTVVKHYEEHPDRFIDGLRDLTLDESLDLQLTGEPDPDIKDSDSPLWWKGSVAQMSYGYELRLTPLQILAFYNAIANGGTKVQPRFIKGFARDGALVKEFSPRILHHSICSGSTLKKAKLLLEAVVDDGKYIDKHGKVQYSSIVGTAFNLKRASYGIAGKTGTAQLYQSKKNYGSEGDRAYQASFVGYFPAENPKYSCIVVINNPKGANYYGNTVAGEVFKEIADYTVASDLDLIEEREEPDYVKMPVSSNGYKEDLEQVFDELDLEIEEETGDSEWILTNNKDSLIVVKDRVIPKTGVVPNVLGMGLKDALFILENHGLRVKVAGYGTVKRQNPGPGAHYKRGQQITISLS